MYRQRFTVINIIKYLQISKNNRKKNKWNTPIKDDGQAIFIRNTSDHWTYGNSFNPTTMKSKLKWQRDTITLIRWQRWNPRITHDCVMLISRHGKTGTSEPTGGSWNWHDIYGGPFGNGYEKPLKTYVPTEPVFPLLGISPIK